MENNNTNSDNNIANSENEISTNTVTNSENSNANVPNEINIDNMALSEYFEVVKNEYEIERNKKVSFENRAGIFLALIGTIGVYLFDKVQIKEIIPLFSIPLTFGILMKIISCFLVYLSLAFTMLYLIKTITVKHHNNFEVRNIDEVLLAENRINALTRIIFTYRDIICQHRQVNEDRAKTFRLSLYGVVVMLIATVIYISL